MKKKLHFFWYGVFAVFISCNGGQSKEPPKADNVPPGTVVACDSMPINDPLNHFYFALKIISTEATKYGTYDIKTSFGNNDAASQFTMPKGGEHLKPIIKKGDEPYTYIIGFYYQDNKTFYDYYQVNALRGQITMKYLKAYSFQ